MKNVYSIEHAIKDYQIAKCNKQIKFNKEYSIIFEALELILNEEERTIFRSEFLVNMEKDWWIKEFNKKEYLDLRLSVHKKIIEKMKVINLEGWMNENNKKV